jgi:DNA-binding IclR family transcriptional regulator
VAVVAENGQNLHSRSVTHTAKIAASTTQRSLESLNKQDILRQDEKSGTMKFRFEDPFFAYWIQIFSFLDS